MGIFPNFINSHYTEVALDKFTKIYNNSDQEMCFNSKMPVLLAVAAAQVTIFL
jgi:hypothetical protein